MAVNKQIFFWYGDNDYEIHEKVNSWVKAFEKKHTGLNIVNLDLADNRPKDQLFKDLKNALQVDSLFGINKLIILKNFITPQYRLTDEVKTLLLDAFEKLSDNFFLVFSQKKAPDKRELLYKKISAQQKSGRVEIKEFQVPRGSALIKWILNKAKQYEINLSPEAVNLMSAMVGSDLWQLDNEICKLANFKKQDKLTTEDINLLVKGKYNDDIFQLMDAISDKDKKKTLQLFQDQIDSGASEMYLLTMLIRQFRIFWQVKELNKAQSLAPPEIARELGIHPFVAKKSLYYSKHFTLDEIKAIYKKLLEFEILMKTKNVGFEVLFDLLVAGLK